MTSLQKSRRIEKKYGKYYPHSSIPISKIRSEIRRSEVGTFGARGTKMHSEAQTSPQSGNNPSENKKLSAQCPRCKSYKTIKKGLSKTLNRGNQQRNICKECKYSFIVDKGFWKMKFSEAKVNQAIDTYFEGLSLRKVRRNFHRYSELKVSHQSILNWIHKYSYLMKQYVETLEPRLSGHFMTDETMIRCNGKWHNLGVVFDKHTRYVVATRYSEYEYISAEDNIKLWNEAKQIKRPYKFSSDSHITYEEAFKKVFYSRYKKDFVEWNKINCAKTGQFNFIMERLFNSLKERIKIMRGFKAGWSAKLVLDGYFIWYNFIRPHQTFNGVTPSKKAQLELNYAPSFLR